MRGWFIVPEGVGKHELHAEIGAGQFRSPLGNPLEVYCHLPAPFLAELGCDVGNLYCLYTFGSTLCFTPFQYRIRPSGSLDVLSYSADSAILDFAGDIDESKRCLSFKLQPMERSFPKLIDKLALCQELSAKELLEFAEATGNFADDSVGGYPYIDVYCQILGGQTFLSQRPDVPLCAACEQEMTFLACLKSETKLGTTFIPEGLHVVFHICLNCLIIDATHYA